MSIKVEDYANDHVAAITMDENIVYIVFQSGRVINLKQGMKHNFQWHPTNPVYDVKIFGTDAIIGKEIKQIKIRSRYQVNLKNKIFIYNTYILLTPSKDVCRIVLLCKIRGLLAANYDFNVTEKQYDDYNIKKLSTLKKDFKYIKFLPNDIYFTLYQYLIEIDKSRIKRLTDYFQIVNGIIQNLKVFFFLTFSYFIYDIIYNIIYNKSYNLYLLHSLLAILSLIARLFIYNIDLTYQNITYTLLAAYYILLFSLMASTLTLFYQIQIDGLTYISAFGDLIILVLSFLLYIFPFIVRKKNTYTTSIDKTFVLVRIGL